MISDPIRLIAILSQKVIISSVERSLGNRVLPSAAPLSRPELAKTRKMESLTRECYPNVPFHHVYAANFHGIKNVEITPPSCFQIVS
jgi:hypothetical protein